MDLHHPSSPEPEPDFSALFSALVGRGFPDAEPEIRLHLSIYRIPLVRSTPYSDMMIIIRNSGQNGARSLSPRQRPAAGLAVDANWTLIGQFSQLPDMSKDSK